MYPCRASGFLSVKLDKEPCLSQRAVMRVLRDNICESIWETVKQYIIIISVKGSFRSYLPCGRYGLL